MIECAGKQYRFAERCEGGLFSVDVSVDKEKEFQDRIDKILSEKG